MQTQLHSSTQTYAHKHTHTRTHASTHTHTHTHAHVYEYRQLQWPPRFGLNCIIFLLLDWLLHLYASEASYPLSHSFSLYSFPQCNYSIIPSPPHTSRVRGLRVRRLLWPKSIHLVLVPDHRLLVGTSTGFSTIPWGCLPILHSLSITLSPTLLFSLHPSLFLSVYLAVALSI